MSDDEKRLKEANDDLKLAIGLKAVGAGLMLTPLAPLGTAFLVAGAVKATEGMQKSS